MAQLAPAEIALYAGIALVLVWVVYRLYLSFSVRKEGFADAGNHSLTMYYADWCGHCKTTKPEFAKLGSTQTIAGKLVNIKMVNPETHPDAAEGVDIKGYPTIILKSGEQSIEYPGGRTHSEFLSFLKQHVK